VLGDGGARGGSEVQLECLALTWKVKVLGFGGMEGWWSGGPLLAGIRCVTVTDFDLPGH
jgi:hypothetical protein